MATISKKAEYAVAALAELAGSTDSYVSSHTVAQKQMIPPNLISQLLSTMSRAGWVSAVRGPRGGVRLERDPESISLYDVIELFDGPLGITRCLEELEPCRRQAVCQMRQHWAEAQRRMLEVLRNTSIQDLVQSRSPGD